DHDSGGGGESTVNILESLPASESIGTPAAVSLRGPMTCAGCGEQVCDRFFLLAAGGVWHGACLRCSRCRCELQTHASLFWREGNIYCQQDYCRMFGGGRCARCFQPIPASALVMRSGELTFHPHCFSCQECDVTLTPGNLYCLQGHNLYCQSHYHGDEGGVQRPRDLQPNPNLREGEAGGRTILSKLNFSVQALIHRQNCVCESALNPVSGDGEESVSSPEPRLDDGEACGRSHRRTKRIRTCFRSEQLRALESYFAQKHNPDGKDWNCLAHKTGLPKRVLQVRTLPGVRPPARRIRCKTPPSSRTAIPTMHRGACPPWRPTRTFTRQEEEQRAK
uniref:LIM/homeobox protein Lhx9 n=1 Tax=Gasterosteus aculeatus aculeatus TaxID=481459 RepID=G3P5H7_GASAC